MNQHLNYNEPFPECWDPETIVTHISRNNGTLTLHSTSVEAEEFTFPYEAKTSTAMCTN